MLKLKFQTKQVLISTRSKPNQAKAKLDYFNLNLNLVLKVKIVDVEVEVKIKDKVEIEVIKLNQPNLSFKLNQTKQNQIQLGCDPVQIKSCSN